MKEKFERIKPSEENFLIYLLIFAILYRCMPYMINVIILIMIKMPISHGTNQLIRESSLLVLIAGTYFLGKKAGYAGRMEAFAAGLILAFAQVFEETAGIVLFQKVMIHMMDKIYVFMAVCIALEIIYTVLFAIAMPKENNKMKDFLKIWGIWVMRTAALILLEKGLNILSLWMNMSFAANLLVLIMAAMADAGFLYWIYCCVGKKINRDAPSREKKTFPASCAAGAVGIIVLTILGVVAVHENPIEQIQAGIAEELVTGGKELIFGNVESAYSYFQSAEEKKEAWESVLEIAGKQMDKNSVKKSSMLEKRFLYWQKDNDIKAIENYLYEENIDMDIACALLYMYKEQERQGNVLPERSEMIRKDIISLMISNNYFTKNIVWLKDVENHENELEEKLALFDEAEIYCQAVSVLRETGVEGSVTQKQVDEILDIAESRPDDICLQYIGVVYGNSCKRDNSRHYERTIQAGERFVELVKKQDGVTDEQIYQCQLQLAEWAMNLGFFELAEQYIQDVLQVNESEAVLLVLAQCQDALGKKEECYETAKKILEKDSDNAAGLYYSICAGLENEDFDTVIENTGILCNQILQTEGHSQHQIEVLLYNALQKHGSVLRYKKITPEQVEKIDSNPFYSAYYNAMYKCFITKEYEDALQQIDIVLSYSDNLSQALYLKGCIYYGMDDFENAAVYYKEALKIDDTFATAWYSLACCYDALGKYEEAYEACLRVDDLLPDTDHVFDPYGVAAHCSGLQAELAAILKYK